GGVSKGGETRRVRGYRGGAVVGSAAPRAGRTPKLLPRHAYVIETTIGSSVAVRPSSYDHLHNPDTPVQAPRPTGFTPEQLREELDELTRETRKRRNRGGGQNNQNQRGPNQNNQQNRGNQHQGGNQQQQQQQQNNQQQAGNQQAQQQNVGGGAQQVAPVPGQVQQRGPGPTWADLIDTRVQRHI